MTYGWLVFRNNETRTWEYYIGDLPIEVSEPNYAVMWEPEEDDYCPQNYLRDGETISRSVNEASPTASPDPDGMGAEMVARQAPWELFALFSLIKHYPGNAGGEFWHPSVRQNCWALLKSQGLPFLTKPWVSNMERWAREHQVDIT